MIRLSGKILFYHGWKKGYSITAIRDKLLNSAKEKARKGHAIEEYLNALEILREEYEVTVDNDQLKEIKKEYFGNAFSFRLCEALSDAEKGKIMGMEQQLRAAQEMLKNYQKLSGLGEYSKLQDLEMRILKETLVYGLIECSEEKAKEGEIVSSFIETAEKIAKELNIRLPKDKIRESKKENLKNEIWEILKVGLKDAELLIKDASREEDPSFLEIIELSKGVFIESIKEKVEALEKMGKIYKVPLNKYLKIIDSYNQATIESTFSNSQTKDFFSHK